MKTKSNNLPLSWAVEVSKNADEMLPIWEYLLRTKRGKLNKHFYMPSNGWFMGVSVMGTFDVSPNYLPQMFATILTISEWEYYCKPIDVEFNRGETVGTVCGNRIFLTILDEGGCKYVCVALGQEDSFHKEEFYSIEIYDNVSKVERIKITKEEIEAKFNLNPNGYEIV